MTYTWVKLAYLESISYTGEVESSKRKEDSQEELIL